MSKYYALVTFGQTNEKKVWANQEDASAAAYRSKGRLNCSTARVYECDTRELAKTSDISVIRDGERCVMST